jgi:16S rRNA (guanine(966)-N(2))-methyltransferase RsmD
VTRIVGGRLGGRRLHPPRGAATRPTTDLVREALASSLLSMRPLSGVRVLDLYAGSGAVGLELVSRGAAVAVLVERDARAARQLRETVAALGVTDVVQVVQSSAASLLAQPLEERRVPTFDVVYVDPPYALRQDALEHVLARLARPGDGWLASDAVVVVERDRRTEGPIWPPSLRPGRRRDYGDTTLWYGHVAPTPTDVLPP